MGSGCTLWIKGPNEVQISFNKNINLRLMCDLKLRILANLSDNNQDSHSLDFILLIKAFIQLLTFYKKIINYFYIP